MPIGSHNFDWSKALGPGIKPEHRSRNRNMDLQTSRGDRPIRLNSRTWLGTSGSNIGFQCKPAQGVSAATKNVIGCEISPRVNSGVAVSSVIGAHIDAFLRGTAAGAIGGDVRGLELEMVTDDGGIRAITGNVSAIRIRSAFSANSIGGKFVPLRIEKPEAQTNSKTYDAVLELTSTVPGVWNDDPATELPGAIKGYFKVLVNGAARYVALYDTAPTD